MGVSGLWDLLNKVGTSASLAKLATDAFEKNGSRRRAYRVGIDVSIWFHHSEFSKEGENPELRNLFFRLKQFATLPIVPLFVFDGRERPKVKRGSKLGKSGSHALSQQFKLFLDAFGMEWREAPGEAEAELAYLNQEGHIDVIVTDDVDAFIFGARTLYKNISSNLSGNKNNLAKNSAGKTDKMHSMIYRIEDINSHTEVSLKRGGLILFALLAGGDYDKGADKIGKGIAYGLARCGFGDDLLGAYQNLPGPEFNEFLLHWRTRVNTELGENNHGFLPHRCVLSLPDTFPLMDVLKIYADPLTSKRQGSSNSIALRDRQNLDLGQIAHLCEKYFERGYKEKIIERFRTLLWPCAVMHVLRRAALEVDEEEQRRPGSRKEVGTPSSIVNRYLGKETRLDRLAGAFANRGPNPQSQRLEAMDTHPLIVGITGTRQHASTDGVLEYRIEVSPIQLVNITTAGIQGTRQPLPPKEGARVRKTEPDPPNSSFKLWMPACIMEHVHPTMVERFITGKANKAKGKGRGKGKGKGKEESSEQASSAVSMSDDDDFVEVLSFSTPSTTQSSTQEGNNRDKVNGKRKQRASFTPMSEIDSPYSSSPPMTQVSVRLETSEFQHHRSQASGSSSETRAVLEPWFTSVYLPCPGISRRPPCRGFFFTFGNPDPLEYYADLEGNSGTGERTSRVTNERNNFPDLATERAIGPSRATKIPMDMDDNDESDRPLTRFEMMIDQCLLAPSKKRKASGRSLAGRRSQPAAKRRKGQTLEVDLSQY